jgi:hypothetical protein
MCGLALTPGPAPAPLDPPQACPRDDPRVRGEGRGLRERGDSGARVWPPMAVDSMVSANIFSVHPVFPAYAGNTGAGVVEEGDTPHQEAASLIPIMGTVPLKSQSRACCTASRRPHTTTSSTRHAAAGF